MCSLTFSTRFYGLHLLLHFFFSQKSSFTYFWRFTFFFVNFCFSIFCLFYFLLSCHLSWKYIGLNTQTITTHWRIFFRLINWNQSTTNSHQYHFFLLQFNVEFIWKPPKKKLWTILFRIDSVRRRMQIVMVMWTIAIQKKKKFTMIYVQYKELIDRRYNFGLFIETHH